MIWQNRIIAEAAPRPLGELSHGRQGDAVEMGRNMISALLEPARQLARQPMQPVAEGLDRRGGIARSVEGSASGIAALMF